MKFKCDKCGLCCKHLDNHPIYSELDRGDGVCKYLKNDLCTIYERRPDICNVERAYDLYYKEAYKYEDYLKLNTIACIKLKETYKEK